MSKKLEIVVLDANTLGRSQNILNPVKSLGELTVYEETKENQVQERVKTADVILTNKVPINESTMGNNNQVKFIGVLATGMNNIDFEYTRRQNIHVANVADYSTHSVAQHTFSMILELVSKISWYDNFVKSGEYSKKPQFTHIESDFFELNNKTIGIIGLGNIGKQVAKIASSFGMKVVYYSTSGQNNNEDYERTSLETLLSQSDFVSIHAPLNDNTMNLIGEKQLAAMKKSAILINVGRGGIVKEDALASAIDNSIIAGACLDVFSDEPLPKESVLLKVKDKNKLILTPHIAWASIEARNKLIEKTVSNIKDHFDLAS